MISGTLLQLGGRRRFLVAEALNELGCLGYIFCDFLLKHNHAEALNRIPLLGSKLMSNLWNRVLPPGVDVPMKRKSVFFFSEQVRKSVGLRKPASDMFALGEMVQWRVARLNLESTSFVYAYDKAAAVALEIASRHGVRAVLDQTIAPNDEMHEILRQEADAAGVPFVGFSDAVLKLIMEEQERSWAVADVIICGSAFVEQKLRNRGLSGNICPIRPVLRDSRYIKWRRHRKGDKSRPLRLLTVGHISIRKGSHIAFEAARQLGESVEWRFVGNIAERIQPLVRDLPRCVSLQGFRRGVALMEEYDWADVFVLPSLWEGSAYVVTEAAYLGLPCVVTFSTGAWIENGVDGFVLDEASPERLVAYLTELLDRPGLVAQMSAAAIQSTNDYSWNNYKRALAFAVCPDEETLGMGI